MSEVAGLMLRERSIIEEDPLRKPLRTILHCPKCQEQHIDEGEWATKPHHTHECQLCAFKWRVEPYCVGVGWDIVREDRACPGCGAQFGHALDCKAPRSTIPHGNPVKFNEQKDECGDLVTFAKQKDEKLRQTVRAVIAEIEKSSPGTGAGEAIRPLLNLGIRAGCGRHLFKGGVGELSHPDDSYETLYWYAGEIVDVVESRSWFAVNSLINCVDKFAGVK